MFACSRCIPSASIDVALLPITEVYQDKHWTETICLKATVEHSGFKKIRADCISSDFHEFKIYVNFFIILYSILSTVKYTKDWRTTKDELEDLKFGRKIMYDLSNLVYSDIIQNSCILKLLLFTSVLFDILGYVLSQNF